MYTARTIWNCLQFNNTSTWTNPHVWRYHLQKWYTTIPKKQYWIGTRKGSMEARVPKFQILSHDTGWFTTFTFTLANYAGGMHTRDCIQSSPHILCSHAFPLILNMSKYLLKLNNLTEEEIRVKIEYLAFAQRLIFTDRPQSLFVPTMLKEVTEASEISRLWFQHGLHRRT